MARKPITEPSDARFREALDAMPHKVWVVRTEGPAVYYNAAMRAFAGAALDLADRPSRERALIHPDDLPRFVAARDAGQRSGRPWSVEVRLRRRDGVSRWHRVDVSVLRLAGRSEAWLVTATDIDDLQRAVADARHSEERLRLAAEAAQLGIYSFDLDSQEHVWSPELKDIFGLPETAAPPPHVLECIHPDDRPRFEALRRASLDPQGEGSFQDEHRILRPDGSVRWVLVRGRVAFAGEGASRRPVRGLGLVLDVTNRKTAEQMLAQSEARYRTLVENASDIVAMLALDGRILSVNPAIHRILGYTPEEVIGRTLAEFVPADQMPMQYVMLDRKLKGEPSTRYDLEVITKGGQRRVLEVSSRLVFDDAGLPAAVHSVARDISERKEAEARQRLLVGELQHRTRNLLAVIQAIATGTLGDHPDYETFVGRLHALAHAQEFVAAGPQGGVPLRGLVDAELAPFGTRVAVSGEDIVVGGSFAQAFALVVHELATNALKHGAFSVPDGHVRIEWRVAAGGGEPQLEIAWIERGGPPVRAPATAGFGSRLMAALGEPRLDFAADGFEYRLSVPLAEATRVAQEPAGALARQGRPPGGT